MAQTLYTIEVYYNSGHGETCRYVLRNLTAPKLRDVRETIVVAGLALPVATESGMPDELGHWRMVLPQQIISIDIYQQKEYFDEKKK